MQLEVPQDKSNEIRFYNVRKHIFNHNKTSRKGLTISEINKRKKISKIGRQNLANSQEGVEFFNWIFSIRDSLNLDNYEFAKVIGVNIQVIKFWKNKKGHFPSHDTFKRLEELERLIRIKSSNNVGIK